MPTPDLMSQLQAHYAANPGAVPIGVPGMPGYTGMPPQLQHPVVEAPGWPAPTPGPAPGVLTADQVRAIVDERLKAATPAPDLSRLQAVIQQVDDLARRALPADDYMELHRYIAGGGQGFADMVAGDKLHPIMQLMWETIRENKK